MQKDTTISLIFTVMLYTSLEIRTVYKIFQIHLIECCNMPYLCRISWWQITLDWQGYVKRVQQHKENTVLQYSWNIYSTANFRQ
jgi:hypothetical protein